MADSRAPRSEDVTTSTRAEGRPSRGKSGKSVKDQEPRSGEAGPSVPQSKARTPAGRRDPTRTSDISQGQRTETSRRNPKTEDPTGAPKRKGKEVKGNSSKNESKGHGKGERTARDSPRGAHPKRNGGSVPSRKGKTPCLDTGGESEAASEAGLAAAADEACPRLKAMAERLLDLSAELWRGRERYQEMVRPHKRITLERDDLEESSHLAESLETVPDSCFWLSCCVLGRPIAPTTEEQLVNGVSIAEIIEICSRHKIPLYQYTTALERVREYKVTLTWMLPRDLEIDREQPGILIANSLDGYHAMPFFQKKRSYKRMLVDIDQDFRMRQQDLEREMMVERVELLLKEAEAFECLSRVFREEHAAVGYSMFPRKLRRFPGEEPLVYLGDADFSQPYRESVLHMNQLCEAYLRETIEWFGSVVSASGRVDWAGQKNVDVVHIDFFDQAIEAKYVLFPVSHPNLPGLQALHTTVEGLQHGFLLQNGVPVTIAREQFWLFEVTCEKIAATGWWKQFKHEVGIKVKLPKPRFGRSEIFGPLESMVCGWRTWYPLSVGKIEFHQNYRPEGQVLPAPGTLLAGEDSENRLGFAVMNFIVRHKLKRPEAEALGSLILRYALATGKPPDNPLAFGVEIDLLCNRLNALPETRVGSWSPPWELPLRAGPPSTKNCPSCGAVRPSKYRWKHAMCDRCSKQENGVTKLAQWYTEGASVGPGAPGIIHMLSRSLPLEGDLCYEDIRITLPHYITPQDRQGWQQEPVHSSWAVGFLIGGAPPRVTTLGLLASYDAVKCRIFRRKEFRASPEYWDMARAMIPDIIPLFPVVGRMSVSDWLSTMPRRRRRALTQAAELYERTGYLSKYGKFQSFVKQELLTAFEQGLDLTITEECKNRLIQGPHDAAHVIVGPVVKPFVLALKKAFGWEPNASGIFYASRKPEEIDAWFNDGWDGQFPRTYFWCDYSMFDCTHSTESWDFVEGIYRRFCTTDPDFWKVMAAWRAPRGTMRDRDGQKLTYQAPVMNASGRDDTAGANCLVNAFAIALSLASAWHMVSVLDLTPEVVRTFLTIAKIGVCGDDTLCILPALSNTKQFCAAVSNELQSGFGLLAGPKKMGCSTDVFDAVFLGQRPYPVSGTSLWAFGPTLGRRLFKHHVYRGDGDPYAWLNGVAKMEALCYRHVPILYEQAVRVTELLTGRKVTPYQPEHEYSMLSRTSALPQWDERTLVYLANGYDMSYDKFRALIQDPLKATRLPYILRGADYESIMVKDAC